MEQWEAENWRKKIELTVIKPVLAAVQSVAPDIQGVDFDLQNGAVIIDSPTVLIDDQWKRVQEIGEEKIRSIVGLHFSDPNQGIAPLNLCIHVSRTLGCNKEAHQKIRGDHRVQSRIGGHQFSR